MPAALLSVVALISLTAWVANLLDGYARAGWDQRIDAAASAAASALEADWPDEPSESVQALAKSMAAATRLRVTLIGPAGRVIADSECADLAAVREMENHQNRVEVVEAMRSGSGWRTRQSGTFGRRFRYRALQIDRDGQRLGVVRTAGSSAAIEATAAAARRAVWLGGLITMAVTAVGISWVLSRGTRPARELSVAAQNLAAGTYDQLLPAAGYFNDELAALAASLGEIGRRLAKREYQLHRNWQTQSTILEGMTEGVIAVNAEQRILFSNRAAGRAMGFNAQAVEGRTLLEAVRSHELREACQQAIADGEPQERVLAWRSGKNRIFEAHASPMPGDPCPGAVLVLRDISELKRLENLRQEFMANVSHELKTPLSSIKAYAETLLNGALHDPQHAENFLHRIDEQSDRLNQLVMDMLSLARLEAGQAAVEVSDVPIARVAARCVADFQQLAAAGSVQLENRTDDSDLVVRADEEALWQILSNLIDNAVKYTPAGGQVTVAAEADGEMAVIRVTDTGPGIAPQHHRRLFERFYRVDKARSRELGGTGLGLSIVKHLSGAMGGSVAVDSRVGKGATFEVRLPLAGG